MAEHKKNARPSTRDKHTNRPTEPKDQKKSQNGNYDPNDNGKRSRSEPKPNTGMPKKSHWLWG